MVACSPVPSTSGTSSSRTVGPNVSKSQSDESSMMSIIKSIQDNQKKQDDKINSLTGKMSDIMNDYQYDNYEDYDHDNANYDDEEEENEGEPRAKKQKNETNNNTDNEKTSRFSNMAKRFKVKDACGEKIDDVLAQNVTSLFLNGMDEEQYNDLVKDEKTPRPENCEGLKIVKTNQLVWDTIPTFSQTCDKKMQIIEKTLVKAATILTKVVDKMAKLDTDQDENSEVLDNYNDTIASLGHANIQINLARREFMKPDLDANYVHLCAVCALPKFNVSKAAKDIEDTRKIGSKLGGYRGRPFYRGGRGRGFRREFSGVVEVATVVASHTDQEIDLMIPQKTSGEEV
jgi:phosphopantetheine adenylyltransferase